MIVSVLKMSYEIVCVGVFLHFNITLRCTVVTASIQIREDIDGDLILRGFILRQAEIKIFSVLLLDASGNQSDFDNA